MELAIFATIFLNISVSMTVLALKQKSFFMTFWLFFQFFVFSATLGFSSISTAIVFMIIAIMLILFFFQKDEVVFTDQVFERPDTWRYVKKIVNSLLICIITSLAITVKYGGITEKVINAKEAYNYEELQGDPLKDHSEYFLLAVASLLVLLIVAGGMGLLRYTSAKRHLNVMGSSSSNSSSSRYSSS
jgi:hypothetical protein